MRERLSADELYDFWRDCQKVDKRVTPVAAAVLARQFLRKKQLAERRRRAH